MNNGLLKFITCGSVDDGKSTLIGNILYNSKLLYADQEEALLLDSKVGSRGGNIDYSLLLDGLIAEREQGITIDVAYRYFTTDKRSFIVADTPGHEEYTRNMAVGSSFAQLSILLIDASQGVLVQTRRHARICSLIGIKHFIFAVNKMDLVDYSEEKFNEIVKSIEELSNELSLKYIKIIPISATEGDNVTIRSENMPWYTGDTIIDHLESVDVSEKNENSDFYIPIQRVCRPNHDFRGFQGQIESGNIKIGQSIRILPSNETAIVKMILNGNNNVSTAYAGQSVTIQLDREVDVSRGCVLTSNENLPVSKKITATLLWMDDNKLILGKEYLVKIGTKKIPGILKKIQYKIDVNTGEKVDVTSIEKNEIALCELEFIDKVIVDKFEKNKTLGELILIDRLTHMTSASGVVEYVHIEDEKPYFEKDEIKIGGYIFEEFFFKIENARLSRLEGDVKTYHVGDNIKVEGESFKFPDYFDIISVESNAAVLVRNRKIFDIITLEEYKYMGPPMLDEYGFEILIKREKDFLNYIDEFNKSEKNEKSYIQNKWKKFETYRRIVCNDNFWVI